MTALVAALGNNDLVRRMNRRDFVVHSSLLVSAALLPRSLYSAEGAKAAEASKAPPAPAVTQFRPLRRGVGLFTGRGGSIGWLSSNDALVVVDTQFPDTAAICLSGLPDRAGRQIDAVLNTHHHPDHTSGNGVFKPATKTIVAHENAIQLQQERAEKDGTLTQQVFADTTFPDVWRRQFGDEIVTAQYFGAAHTKGDVIVSFEKASVVHMGDLTFNRVYPVIDRPGGASVRHWVTVLEEAMKAYPSDAIYIFGHGNPKFGVTGGHADIAMFRDYLSGLLAHVEKEIAAGKTKDQIVTLENLPGFPEFHSPLPNRLGSNLSVVYDELTQTAG
jgi:glyoxylase-like metal-dependent hydrolase (beta-lactamase superfamily II)